MGLITNIGRAVKVLIGQYPDNPPPYVERLLNASLPGGRGEPPPRGTREFLEAYEKMPWLRAVVDKVAIGVGAVQWKVLVVRGKSGKAVRNRILQRAPHHIRLKLLDERRQAGDLDELEEHPLLSALHDANEMMTGTAVRALNQVYLELVGDSFFIMERNVAGMPISLWPLPPHWVQRTPSFSNRFFELSFNGWSGLIPDTEILWAKNMRPLNPYGRGTGLAGAVAADCEIDDYAKKWAGSFFFNHARPDLIISPELAPNEQVKGDVKENMERFEQRWGERLRGFFKAFKPFFSSRPIKVEQIQQGLESVKVVELRQFERDVIRQVFGVPPEILGITESSNRATITAADYIMGKHVLLPRLEFLRELLQERLVPNYDERLILDYASPIESDPEMQAAAAAAAPWVRTADEWRKATGDPLLGEENGGNVHMVQMGLVGVEDLREYPALDMGFDPNPASAPTPEVRPAADGDGASGKKLDRIRRMVRKDTRTRDFAAIHRIAERLTPRVRVAFRTALATIRDQVALEAIERALEQRNAQAIVDAIPWAELEKSLNGTTKILRECFRMAGEVEAATTGAALGAELVFNLENPRAVAGARQHAANLVRYVSDTTKENIRDVVATTLQGLDEGLSVGEAARLIKANIGLTPQQGNAVFNFRQRLIDSGVDPAKIQSRVAKYADAQLLKRSKMVARSETITWANRGQRETWQQAKDQGLIDGEWLREFIVTPDDRLDPNVCEPMDEQVVAVNEPFLTGDGRMAMDPGVDCHPGCRCGQRLRPPAAKSAWWIRRCVIAAAMAESVTKRKLAAYREAA